MPLVASTALAGAVWAQGAQLALLDQLERGNWSLTYRDNNANGKICLAGGRELIQLRHSHLKCRSIIVDDTPYEVAVQYTCPGNGYGRTHRSGASRIVWSRSTPRVSTTDCPLRFLPRLAGRALANVEAVCVAGSAG